MDEPPKEVPTPAQDQVPESKYESETTAVLAGEEANDSAREMSLQNQGNKAWDFLGAISSQDPRKIAEWFQNSGLISPDGKVKMVPPPTEGPGGLYDGAGLSGIAPRQVQGQSFERPGVKVSRGQGEDVEAPQKPVPPPEDTDPAHEVKNEGGAVTVPSDVPAAESESTPEAEKEKLEVSAEIQQKLEKEEKELREHIANLPPELQAIANKGLEDLKARKDGKDGLAALSPAEIAETMHQLNRLYDGKLINGLDEGDRSRALAAGLYDAGNPRDISQGENNTCGPTAVLKGDMTTNPSEAAKLLADMYTAKPDVDGKYFVTLDNKQKVEIDPASLHGGREAAAAAIPGNVGQNVRDQFTQAMNHLYVNAVKQPLGIYYTDGDRVDGTTNTGEVRHLKSFDGEAITDKDGNIDHSPGVGADHLAYMDAAVGGTDQVSVAANKGHFKSDYSDALVQDVRTPEQLRDAFEKSGGNLTVGIDWGEGGHAVPITGMRVNEQGQREYYMSFNWNKGTDGWVKEGDVVALMGGKPSSIDMSNYGKGDYANLSQVVDQKSHVADGQVERDPKEPAPKEPENKRDDESAKDAKLRHERDEEERERIRNLKKKEEEENSKKKKPIKRVRL